MFICNHCPYVKAVRERIVRDTEDLKAFGIGSVAIMSNDVNEYQEDSFDNMKQIAGQFHYGFPYLFGWKPSSCQSLWCRLYAGFFGYNADLELQYRGRLDASRKDAAPADTIRDLFEAMKLVAATGKGPAGQIPSIGCSIKWKQN